LNAFIDQTRGDDALVVAGGARLEFKGPAVLFVTHLLA
jgi:hypothetical protein